VRPVHALDGEAVYPARTPEVRVVQIGLVAEAPEPFGAASPHYAAHVGGCELAYDYFRVLSVVPGACH